VLSSTHLYKLYTQALDPSSIRHDHCQVSPFHQNQGKLKAQTHRRKPRPELDPPATLLVSVRASDAAALLLTSAPDGMCGTRTTPEVAAACTWAFISGSCSMTTYITTLTHCCILVVHIVDLPECHTQEPHQKGCWLRLRHIITAQSSSVLSQGYRPHTPQDSAGQHGNSLPLSPAC
jgi:hypothetical protein